MYLRIFASFSSLNHFHLQTFMVIPFPPLLSSLHLKKKLTYMLKGTYYGHLQVYIFICASTRKCLRALMFKNTVSFILSIVAASIYLTHSVLATILLRPPSHSTLIGQFQQASKHLQTPREVF